NYPGTGAMEVSMEPSTDLADTYRKLAEWHHQHGHPQQRDRFLVLAAYTAHAVGRPEQADSLRVRLLRHNPHHLLKPYTSFAQALTAPDVESYVNDLRRSYPPNTATQLLASLPGKGSSDHGGTVLPPTQPVLNLGDVPKGKEREAEELDALKVYRVR